MSQFLPGYEAGRTMTPREILFSSSARIQVPIVLDGQVSTDGKNGSFPFEIRAGWLLGRLTASGRFCPCKRTTVTPSGGATAADIPVVNAAAFKVGDIVTVGNDTGKQVVAVNYQTNVLSVAGAAFAFGNGEAVFAEDGSATCRGVLLDFVRLRNEDNSAAAHKSAGMLIQGGVKATMVLGDLAAIRADGAARLGGIRFSDDHGIQ